MAKRKKIRGEDEALLPWWRCDEGDDDLHHSMLQDVEYFLNKDKPRRDDMLWHMALYGDEGAKDGLGQRYSYDWRGRNESLTFNLIASVINTMQSEIASLTPKPTFLTQKGDWSLRRKAQNLELMVEGEYDRNKIHTEVGPNAFMDAAKTGEASLKVFGYDGAPKIERVFPGELIVDPIEAQYGDPRTLYQVKFYDKEIIKELFCEDDKMMEAVDNAPEPEHMSFPWLPRETQIKQATVYEAWHLPSAGSNPQPGRHAIVIHGATLVDEEWSRKRFPITTWRYNTPSTGYHGNGVARALRASQKELNHVLGKMQDALRLSAGVRIYTRRASNVNVEQMTNMPYEIVEFDGEPPQEHVSTTIPADWNRHVEDIIRRAFEQEGVSMLSATSRKPSGLDSGAAMREYDDIESRRFQVKTKSFENWLGVDLARLVVDTKVELAKEGNDKPTMVNVGRGKGNYIKEVKWEDCEMDDSNYGIRIFPSSALPSTPAGRTATVEQWFSSGWIDRDQAMRLLDFPDLEEFVSTEMASHEIVLNAIETMIEEGEFMPPEPVQNLELSIQLVQSAYQRYRYEGAPEERTELLLRYMDDCTFLLEDAQKEEMPPEGVMPPEGAMPPEGEPGMEGPPEGPPGMPPGAPPMMQ